MKLKKKRGFAAMSPERQKEAARRGGVRAHEMGVAHKFDSYSGHLAGKKGGRGRKKESDES